MKAQEIKLGKTYFYKNTHQLELVEVLDYVDELGYWAKDVYCEYFWCDAEDLQEKDDV